MRARGVGFAAEISKSDPAAAEISKCDPISNGFAHSPHCLCDAPKLSQQKKFDCVGIGTVTDTVPARCAWDKSRTPLVDALVVEESVVVTRAVRIALMLADSSAIRLCFSLKSVSLYRAERIDLAPIHSNSRALRLCYRAHHIAITAVRVVSDASLLDLAANSSKMCCYISSA